MSLPPSAQAIILCKQLGDFIQAYTKETHLYLGHTTEAREDRNIHVEVRKYLDQLFNKINIFNQFLKIYIIK